MTDDLNLVVPNRGGPSEVLFHSALVAGLSRVAAKIGRGNLADKSNRTTRGLDKLFAGDNCGRHYKALLDFLLADKTALDEVLALYGLKLSPIGAEQGHDFTVIAESAALVATFTDALRDGNRDHRETIAIADKARAVVPHLAAIIAEADQIRGVAR